MKTKFYEKYKRFPTICEISDLTGLHKQKIEKLLISCNDIVSLENLNSKNSEDDESSEFSIIVICAFLGSQRNKFGTDSNRKISKN